MVSDNLPAMVATFLAIALLTTESSYAGSICLAYLGYFFFFNALWS